MNTYDTYTEFKDELIHMIKTTLRENVDVKIVTAIKKNSVKKDVLCLSEVGENITPCIHVKDLYARFQAGDLIQDIVNEILCVYENKGAIKRMKYYKNWEEAKKHITVEVLNRDWNLNLLKYTIHKNFLDLSVICQCVIYENENGHASYNITDDILKGWGITEEELWHTALHNLEKENFYMKDLNEILRTLTGKSREYENKLFVLTNKYNHKGAKGILRFDHFSVLAEKLNSNLYILPCSLHEIICVPANEICNADKLKIMVREINETQVDEEDRLSNNVYYYSRTTGKVTIASE